MATASKSAAIAELTDQFRGSGAAVLTEYRGLTVKQLSQLRSALRGQATFAIVKNTLTELAAKEAGVTAFDGQLVGPSAIAFVSGDPVEAAKSLRDFAKANPLLVIKAGVLDGKALTAAGDHPARGPRVPRGAARQAGRRDERVAQQGGLPLRRAPVPERPPHRGARGPRSRPKAVQRRQPSEASEPSGRAVDTPQDVATSGDEAPPTAGQLSRSPDRTGSRHHHHATHGRNRKERHHGEAQQRRAP